MYENTHIFNMEHTSQNIICIYIYTDDMYIRLMCMYVYMYVYTYIYINIYT